MSHTPSTQTIHLKITGIVQGVGFRPFIARLASRFQLNGYVLNCGSHVSVEVFGNTKHIILFIECIQKEKPDNAEIASIEQSVVLNPQTYSQFQILTSKGTNAGESTIPPDLAICEHCLDEILNPESRFFHYPFNACTLCGPRYTVVKSLPYDREKTTLKCFPLCHDCMQEYQNPKDRRFHAESIACPSCGPVLESESSLESAAEFIAKGGIVALKGMGGFQLACNAENHEAVRRLRDRKVRPHKPFAIMCDSLDSLKKIVQTSEEAENCLKSPTNPIVLLRAKTHKLSVLVSPDNSESGVFLPTTGIHHILFEHLKNYGIHYLIMTSANVCHNPIEYKNSSAFNSLSSICDCFVFHNREIENPADDSVLRVSPIKQILRRSRGFVPKPVFLKTSSDVSILACGSDLKNTSAILYADKLVLSAHTGDLENAGCYSLYLNHIEKLKAFHNIHPEVVVVDKHPGYYSSQWGRTYARELNLSILEVQHHHAHAASCMLEHNLKECIAVILDGTGYGDNKDIWGGELLEVKPKGYERLAALEPVPFPGGDKSVTAPARGLASRLAYYQLKIPTSCSSHLDSAFVSNLAILLKHAPFTSSCGRAFDSFSSLLGLVQNQTYEGQAPIRLQELALKSKNTSKDCYSFSLDKNHACPKILLKGIFEEALQELSTHNPDLAFMALKFHRTMASIIKELIVFGVDSTGINKVVLSGGVFQNPLLTELTLELLKPMDIQIFMNHKIPCNDGGIAAGQAYIAHLQNSM